MFLLIYSWFNQFRRIKFLVEGSLNDFDGQEVKRENNNNENEDSSDKRINERIKKNKKINLITRIFINFIVNKNMELDMIFMEGQFWQS